ncbi:LysR family transcriptional regulator ArgP [Nocardia sp. NPDC057227]|uniref:LysR family transcriptional regulator ArgP n=1 Tax=Nocardia sp. NPDC057227 TaxID=3346056 RepID=UPI003628377E
MDLQLDQLRALSAAVTEGTFEAAARRLHITPSALSQRIKALEDAAGRILVQRVKPVRPTESGTAVLRLARQLELLVGETARELGAEDGTGPVRLPFAVNADSLDTWVMPALARTPPGLSFEIHREDEEHTTALLRDGTVVAAVTATRRAVQGCSVRPLGIMRYRPMAAPEFAATWFPDGADAESLARAPVVNFDRKDNLQEEYLRRRTRRPVTAPRHFVPTPHAYVAAIRLGLGWGMVAEPQLTAATELARIDGDATVDVPLYWQQWKVESPALEALAAAIAIAAAGTLRPVGP